MSSSDAEYRMRLDRLADELERARAEQQKMPPGIARAERQRELDALEEGQDATRRALGLPLCRERREASQAARLSDDRDSLANAHQAEIKRLGLTPEQKARRLMLAIAAGIGILLLALLIAVSLA